VPAAITGCRVEVGPASDDKGSSGGNTSSGTPSPAPTSTTPSGDASPEVQALFGTLPAATPDKLRGVYGEVVNANGSSTDLRFRFDKDRIVGGVKCTVSGKELMVGGTATIDPIDAEAKTGTIKLSQALVFATEKDGVKCTGRLDAATWSFTVTQKLLEMKPQGLEGYVKLDKLGD
jgi:hypothetical protein